MFNNIALVAIVVSQIVSCSTEKKDKERKYYIVIERTSKSLLTNKDEREDRIDSVMATSDESAYDSCIAILWGMRYADSIVNQTLKTELEKQGKISEYNLRKQSLTWKILGVKIINDSGLDIQNNISDSVKAEIRAKWND